MRIKHTPLAALVAISALVLSACGTAESATDAPEESAADSPAAQDASAADSVLTVTHKQGETEVPVSPETVVVFDYGSLDTLLTLGVDVDGAPKDSIPDSLSYYDTDAVAAVGTLFEPDYEAINALDPDLVIVGGRSAAAYPELSQHWATIDLSVDYNDYVADIETSTTILGEIFAKEAEAQAAIEELGAVVAEVQGIGAQAGPGMILSTSGGEVTIYGPDSRFGIIHTVLGVPEAVNDVEPLTHGEVISFEMIRDTDPTWLFVNDRDAAVGQSGEAAAAILDNELVHATTAWQEDQVVYLDAQRWYIIMSGVGNAKEMFSEIGAALTK